MDVFEERPRLQRYREAYLLMANFYRPMAPGDGMGSIDLTERELKNESLLWQEATAYALQFNKEENTRSFWIGCSSFSTNRAFIWSIEAAKTLAGGNRDVAIKLLELALKEVKSA